MGTIRACCAPTSPMLDRWLEVYRGVARTNGGEPDAARHLTQRANAAGFAQVAASASAWCFAHGEILCTP